MFIPHTFENKIQTIKKVPSVYFTLESLSKMRKYTDVCPNEIGWFGVVQKETKETQDLYLVQDVYLFDQRVHATTTEITPDGIAKFCDKVLSTKESEEALAIINNLRLWGHSHVNMDTSPSGQDDKQMLEFAENNCDYFIRVITNKRGKLRVDVFDNVSNLKFLDIKWEIAYALSEEEENAIDAEYKEMVKVIGHTINYGGNNKHKNFRQNPYQQNAIGFNGGANTIYGDDDYWGMQNEWYEQSEKKTKSKKEGNISNLIKVVNGRKTIKVGELND